MADYSTEGAALVKRRQVDEQHTLLFRAEGIRQERTGVHARVTLGCNGATLAWSNFNIERDEDRLRLSNSAYKHLNGLSAVYPQTYLKNDLDQFCLGLWDAQLERLAPEPMPGAAERVGPTFLLRPYILEGGGTIVFAPPGRGKSYILLLMAVSLDAGLSTLWPTLMSRVLFVNLERSGASVAQRLANVNAVLGLERTRQLPMVNARGRSLVDVAAACERYIGEHDIRCIMVDSISRAGAGTLVADDVTNRVMDQLNRFEIAWLGLGHTPRSDESHVYGSVFFEAAADLVVQLTSEQEEGGPLGIGLQLVKKNDVGSSQMWLRALEFDELGLTGVRAARPGEFVDIEENKRMSSKEMIRQHLLDIGSSSIKEIAEAMDLGESNVNKIVRGPWFTQTGVDARGRGRPTALYGVRDLSEGLSEKSNIGKAPENVPINQPEELPF